jgi:hypothetical protein
MGPLRDTQLRQNKPNLDLIALTMEAASFLAFSAKKI